MDGITLGTQRGYAAEQQLVAEWPRHVGLPVGTAISASIQVIKYLKIRSTVVATAYKEGINQAVNRYYEDGELEVLAIKGLKGFQTRGSSEASK